MRVICKAHIRSNTASIRPSLALVTDVERAPGWQVVVRRQASPIKRGASQLLPRWKACHSPRAKVHQQAPGREPASGYLARRKCGSFPTKQTLDQTPSQVVRNDRMLLRPAVAGKHFQNLVSRASQPITTLTAAAANGPRLGWQHMPPRHDGRWHGGDAEGQRFRMTLWQHCFPATARRIPQNCETGLPPFPGPLSVRVRTIPAACVPEGEAQPNPTEHTAAPPGDRPGAAARAGAWIETPTAASRAPSWRVAPHAGAWIET